MHFDITAAGKALQPVEVCKDSLRHNSFKHHASKATDKNVLFFFVCAEQLGVKALTVEDLLQAQKEISAHNLQLKEQTKQLERDMALLRDHSLLLVRLQILQPLITALSPAVLTCHRTCCLTFAQCWTNRLAALWERESE